MGMIESIWKRNYVAGGDTTEKEEEISHAMKMFTKCEGVLEKNLKGDDLETFKELIEWQEKLLSLYEYIAFRDGFKMGLKLGYESNDEMIVT